MKERRRKEGKYIQKKKALKRGKKNVGKKKNVVKK